MKLHPIIVLVTFFYATVLPAQTINNRPFQASIGLVSSNIDRYDPYTGNRQVKQIAFQAAWEPFKEATWGTNNFISIRSIISPKKDGNEGVEYGFLGLGVGLNHYSDSRRWFIALSFDLRHETYVSHAAYGII